MDVVRILASLALSIFSYGAVAADRIVPVYPGIVIIDSDEQADTERNLREKATGDTQRQPKLDPKATANGRDIPSTGAVVIDSDEQAEAERLATENAKARANEGSEEILDKLDP